MAKDIDAIELLTTQHGEVADLFEEIEEAEEGDEKEALFAEIANSLAVHATIEEKLFYPAVRAKQTEDEILEAFEEHLAVKRILADLLEMKPEDEAFDAKISVLKEQVEHHVEEEEKSLFPQAKKLLSPEELLALAQEMTAMQVELEEEEEEPRFALRGAAAPAP